MKVVAEGKKTYLIEYIGYTGKACRKWVLKEVCKPSEQQALIDALPREIREKLNMRVVDVPVWAIAPMEWYDKLRQRRTEGDAV